MRGRWEEWEERWEDEREREREWELEWPSGRMGGDQVAPGAKRVGGLFSRAGHLTGSHTKISLLLRVDLLRGLPAKIVFSVQSF